MEATEGATAPRILALCALLLALPAGVRAHRPVFVGDTPCGPGEVVAIGDPTISWAFYGRLAAPGTTQCYRFDGGAGQVLFLQVLVPDRADLGGFRPALALAGPGLPGPAEGAAGSLPPGSGSLALAASTGTPGTFFEPFTQITYREYEAHRIPLPESGAYRIEVSAPGGATGPYVLAVGTREVFGPLDVLRYPGWWWRARRHAGSPVWHGAVVLVLGIALTGYALTALVRRRARERDA